jgi:hypothetical protein
MQRVQHVVRCDTLCRTRAGRPAPLRLHSRMRLHVQRLRKALSARHHRRGRPGRVHVLRHRAGVRRGSMDRCARPCARRRGPRGAESRRAKSRPGAIRGGQEPAREDRYRVHLVYEDAEFDDHGWTRNALPLAAHDREPGPSPLQSVSCAPRGERRRKRPDANALPALQ